MMGKRRRLGLLKMGETGHIGLEVVLHDGLDGIMKLRDNRNHLVDMIPRIELHIECYLIISGSSGMKPLSGLTDPRRELCLDEAMDILGILDLELSCIDIREDSLQSVDDRGGIF